MSGKKLVVSHWGPHFSDLLGLWTLSRFGGFDEGFSVAFLKERSKLQNRGFDLENFNSGSRLICVGIGGGKYDEHAKGMIDCEATLIAKDLGIVREVSYDEKVDEPENIFRISYERKKKSFYCKEKNLNKLFAAALRDDLKGSQPFGLGSLIKTMHGFYPEAPAVVMQWAFELFDAVLESGPVLKEERAALMMKAAIVGSVILNERKIEDESLLSRKRLVDWLGKYVSGEAEWQPFNFVDCVAILLKSGANADDWASKIVDAELYEQQYFHTVSAREASNAQLYEVELLIRDVLGFERREIRNVAVAQTDDPHVHKYLLSPEFGYHAAAVIKRDSNGNVSIFLGTFLREIKTDKGIKKKCLPLSFLMPGICAIVRSEECVRRRKMIPSWNVLISEAGADYEQTWHYQEASGILMNGSLTTTVPPTALYLNDIILSVLVGMDNRRLKERHEKFENLRR